MTEQTKPKGIVVCVGFDDLLMITLPRNMRHLSECLVVTSSADKKTQDLVSVIPGARCHVTDDFYKYGAKFNKGLAIEKAFDELGREGWIQIWDADTLFPDHVTLPELQVGILYGTTRRILSDPKKWYPDIDWTMLPVAPDADRISGYFQLFNASDLHIAQLPWYDVTFNHAGGGDGYFDQRWPRYSTLKLPFQVLHLGPWCSSWFGRTYDRLDGQPLDSVEESKELIEQYKAYKNWNGTERPYCDFDERVEVPGYSPSSFAPKPWHGPRKVK